MRIAMILPSLDNKGPAIVVQELCNVLISQGHKCDVYYFDDIVELNMPCKAYKIPFKEKIDISNYDILHSHMFRPDLYVWYHYRRLDKSYNTKFITTLHNPIDYSALRKDYSILQSLCGSLLWKNSLKTFDHIVTLNNDTFSRIRKISNKVSIIYNGRNIIPGCDIDNNDLIRIKDLKKNYKIIGTICGIIKRKGLDQIIRALPELKEFAFVAVGDGNDMERLKKLANTLKVEDRCLWIGKKRNAPNYNTFFDVFVMCSYSEGYPLALVEAAAYGKPTVLSDIKILKSIISDKEVKFYKLNNIDDLVQAVRIVDENKEYYSSNIYNYYKNNLTAGKMTQKYIKLYSDL